MDCNEALAQQIDPVLVRQAMALIEPAQRIALLAHERPDGDCLGSALGFAHMLELSGKTCVPVCADPAPTNLSFLPGLEKLQQTLGDERFDLVIALDAGELQRYGAIYERHRSFLDNAPILNIDHHISSTGCGQVNIIDPVSAATAELLILFQQQAQLPLDTEAAICLLTGLITDTGSFQYTATTPRTMEVGALLLQAGAIPEAIVMPVYRQHSLAQARLQAAVINNAQTLQQGRLIWSWANSKTFTDVGATPDMEDNSAGMLRDIEGVQIAIFFKSVGDPQQTRFSLRCAEPYNAAAISQRFGGGGHARAAGASVPLPMDEAIPFVIKELEKELR